MSAPPMWRPSSSPEVCDQPERAARRDLLALVVLGVAAFALARRFDLFAHLVAGVRHLEGAGADALIVAALVLAIALKLFAWRRWAALRRALVAWADAEATLRRERDLSEAILRTAGSLILVLDRRGHIVRFNRACEELTGYRLAEVGGQPFWELLLLPAEAVRVRAVFAELRAGRYPNTHENHWVTRDGRHRLITWANTALLGAAGEVEYVIATGIDITAQRLAEVERQAIDDHAAIGIALGDLGRRLLACNPAYERLTGYGEAELRGGAFPLATHPEDAARDMALFAELAAGRRETYRLEKRYVRKDGRIVQAQLTMVLVRDATGQPCSALGLVLDITARRAAEVGLTEAQHQLVLAQELAARREGELRWLQSGLTAQERTVLELVAQGLTNAQIGRRLHIQPGTVKTHIHNIGRKWDLPEGGRAALVPAAWRRDLLLPQVPGRIVYPTPPAGEASSPRVEQESPDREIGPHPPPPL